MGSTYSQKAPSILFDGPRHDGKTVADVNKWAQRFLESSENYIGWA
jgi:hypothetical protein